MAGHGRLKKNGVASGPYVLAIHILRISKKEDVDARHRRQVFAVCDYWPGLTSE
jgi:hypothetical protein